MSSSFGGSWRRPCGTRTSSSSSGAIVVTGCDGETSSSPSCMKFMLGTSSSSSLSCVMPNSSFIISNMRKRQYIVLYKVCNNNVMYLYKDHEILHEHLVQSGFMDNYFIWSKHGETQPRKESIIDAMKVLLCVCSIPVGEDMAI
jgi:hypothetical protein